MPNHERIIALPPPGKTLIAEVSTPTQSLINKEQQIDKESFVRRETLGFFQLAVAYGVDSVIIDKIESNWRRGHKPDFYRDLHITNRYLNTLEATQETIAPYAGV